MQNGASVTFTCVVGGHPIDSVKITGPNSLNLDCLAQKSSNKASCTLVDQPENRAAYSVELRSSADEGVYKCTVGTKWQRYTQNVGGSETSSLEAVEKESEAEIQINHSELADKIK